MFKSTQAPINAAIIAGIPNLSNTLLLALLPTSNSLKILLKKCTTPVKAIANSIGKNNAKTGIKIVPKPNPEKRLEWLLKKQRGKL
jgi:hypothetical protein